MATINHDPAAVASVAIAPAVMSAPVVVGIHSLTRCAVARPAPIGNSPAATTPGVASLFERDHNAAVAPTTSSAAPQYKVSGLVPSPLGSLSRSAQASSTSMTVPSAAMPSAVDVRPRRASTPAAIIVASVPATMIAIRTSLPYVTKEYTRPNTAKTDSRLMPTTMSAIWMPERRGPSTAGGATEAVGSWAEGAGAATTAPAAAAAGAVAATGAGAATAATAVSRRMRPMMSRRASSASATDVDAIANSADAGFRRSRPQLAHTVAVSGVKHAGQTVVERSSADERGKSTRPTQARSGVGSLMPSR